MPQKLSVEEIKAVAEAAITAKQVATDARKAADEAGGTDEDLNAAAQAAEKASSEASAKAESLSQVTPVVDPDKEKKKQKLKRKQAIIARQLSELGETTDEDEDEDDEDELDDPDRPLTVRDLSRLEANKAKKTAVQMAEAIEDPEAAKAVKEALGKVVASGDPIQDFQNAVAIASAAKNSQVLEELRRKGPPVQYRSGAGAPPKPPTPEFVMTEEERRFVSQGWLTEAEVKEARKAASQAQK